MWGIPGTANSAPTVLPTTTTTTTTTTPVVATTTPNSFPSYVVVTNPYPNNNPPVQVRFFCQKFVSPFTNLSPVCRLPIPSTNNTSVFLFHFFFLPEFLCA
eukprot:TRINITY_DN2640_c0_g1_i22.p1 TRINITY_DN2640_c0_g1~~TRINITY_DN2640_c0_g1_i22.p1  ORF type:complete len:101 (-),score=19.17 TRINITY_DN2640_c0_g1_i22:14-316(-)